MYCLFTENWIKPKESCWNFGASAWSYLKPFYVMIKSNGFTPLTIIYSWELVENRWPGMAELLPKEEQGEKNLNWTIKLKKKYIKPSALSSFLFQTSTLILLALISSGIIGVSPISQAKLWGHIFFLYKVLIEIPLQTVDLFYRLLKTKMAAYHMVHRSNSWFPKKHPGLFVLLVELVFISISAASALTLGPPT